MAEEKTFQVGEQDFGFGEKDDTLYRHELGDLHAPAGTKSDLDMKAKFAEEAHHYISECIRVADQKAAFLFAAGTTFLTFLYHEEAQPWLRSLSGWNRGDYLLASAIVLLTLSALTAAFVVAPRFSKSRRCYIFWESITAFKSAKEYSTSVMNISPSAFIQGKFENCHQLSRLCREKYRYLNIAIWVGLIGWVLTALYLLMNPH
jgi:hypothetical protein